MEVPGSSWPWTFVFVVLIYPNRNSGDSAIQNSMLKILHETRVFILSPGTAIAGESGTPDVFSCWLLCLPAAAVGAFLMLHVPLENRRMLFPGVQVHEQI